VTGVQQVAEGALTAKAGRDFGEAESRLAGNDVVWV
jgi:hypothetical protein